MTAPLRIYDIRTDQFRDVTEADLAAYGRLTAAFGELVTHLRRSDDPAAADLAVEISQGKLTIEEGAERFRWLASTRAAASAPQ